MVTDRKGDELALALLKGWLPRQRDDARVLRCAGLGCAVDWAGTILGAERSKLLDSANFDDAAVAQQQAICGDALRLVAVLGADHKRATEHQGSTGWRKLRRKLHIDRSHVSLAEWEAGG